MVTRPRKGVFYWIIPEQSALLSYCCPVVASMNYISNFFVWISAFWNQHYMVAIATLLVLLGLVFQPLAAAMFTVRDTFLAPPSQFFVR
jgi:hypothetical protein